MSLFSLTEVVNDLKDIFKFQLLVLAHFKAQWNRNSKMQQKNSELHSFKLILSNDYSMTLAHWFPTVPPVIAMALGYSSNTPQHKFIPHLFLIFFSSVSKLILIYFSSVSPLFLIFFLSITQLFLSILMFDEFD